MDVFGRISGNYVSRKAVLGHSRPLCGFLSSVRLITTKALLKKLSKSSSNLRDKAQTLLQRYNA